MKSYASIITALCLSSSTALGANLNGIKLQEYCSDHSATTASVACLMYIEGFVGGINAGDGSKPKGDRIWCFPEGATIGQARLVVEKFLRENPENLHHDAELLVGLALLNAFPCQKEKKPN